MQTEKYDPKSIEIKWQDLWEKARVFEAPDPSQDPLKRKKFYVLCMFPYPSGAIHMGHTRNYTIGDLMSRYKRMQGFNVLHPMGWDSFGLPAENAAIQRGVHPQSWTLQNIASMKNDLKTMGMSYDWTREITTCLPEYYRWEQLLFCEFFKRGLAYKKTGTVNWCPSCMTVLANEQVEDGKCWRCDSVVVQKELSQWYLKITQYAAELLNDHKELEGKWPDRILEMQKHWIGESQGAKIFFKVEGSDDTIEIFTTRADTLFGVTFVTLSPMHPLAKNFCAKDPKKTSDLEALINEMKARPKDAVITEKKGFFTGHYAVHPLTQKKVPIWVGDFVVMDYGTGAVMAVPAHDERDFEFATRFKIPMVRVIVPLSREPEEPMTKAFTEPGVLTASGEFDKLTSEKAKTEIATALKKKNLGEPTIQYRLRDWGISRQRYWGAPIPIIYCKKCGALPVPEKDLPVTLPEDVEFKGTTGNPLERHPTFKKTTCPKCNAPAERETDTMDTFVESSWYQARFTSPHYNQGPFSKKATDEWFPVDIYIGGAEHACMHLLYSRFFHKVLRDDGRISGNEPFARLLSQGMVIKNGAKMSKSKGNVVAVTSFVDKYGADTGRLFTLFAAPPEKDLDWNDKGVEGCHRFLQRVWRLCYQFRDVLAHDQGTVPAQLDEKLLKIRRKTHSTIQKVTDDIESQKYNTAISAFMELVNEIYGLQETDAKALTTKEAHWVVKEALANLLLLLNPFAPHLAEEIWESMGHKKWLVTQPWPTCQKDLLSEATFTLVVQINGKVRDRVELARGLAKGEIEKTVLSLPKLKPYLDGKKVSQFIYIPERIANVVVT